MSTKYLRKIILEELKKTLKEEQNFQSYETEMSSPDTIEDTEFMSVKPEAPYTKDYMDVAPMKIGPCGPRYPVKCNPLILKLQKLMNKTGDYEGLRRIKEDGLRGFVTNKRYKELTNLDLDRVPNSELRQIVVPAFVEQLDMYKKNPKYAIKQATTNIAARIDKLANPEKKSVYPKETTPPAPNPEENPLMKCPSGATRNADGTCPESELNKPIDKTPLKRESLIRKEITKLLKQL